MSEEQRDDKPEADRRSSYAIFNEYRIKRESEGRSAFGAIEDACDHLAANEYVRGREDEQKARALQSAVAAIKPLAWLVERDDNANGYGVRRYVTLLDASAPEFWKDGEIAYGYTVTPLYTGMPSAIGARDERHDETVREFLASLAAGRCYACGWPLAGKVEDGCVPFNCSMRYRDDSRHLAEKEHWHRRATAVAALHSWAMLGGKTNNATDSRSAKP